MEHQIESAIPAGDAAPPSAEPKPVREALKEKDFTAYKAARHAERVAGAVDDLNDHPAAPSAAASEDAEPPKAKETKKEAASSAEPAPKRGEARASENRVPKLLAERKWFEDEATALRLELAALKAKPAVTTTDAKPAASSAATQTADPEPDPADATKYPDGIFDRKFIQDQARWGARQEFRQQTQQAETKAQAERYAKTQVDRAATFHERIKAASEDGDPAKFYETISADVRALKPFAFLGKDEVPSARNAIAEEILSSDQAAAFMRHFTDHPADLTRIAALGPRDVLKEMGKLEASFVTPEKEVRTVTKIADTGTTIGRRPSESTDPVESALKRKDFTAYKAANRAKLLAALR